MRLTDFLKKEHVKVFLQGKSKDELITELTDILLSENKDPQVDEAKKAGVKVVVGVKKGRFAPDPEIKTIALSSQKEKK